MKIKAHVKAKITDISELVVSSVISKSLIGH